MAIDDDVRDRQKTENVPKRGESRLRALFQNTHDGIILFDHNGILKYLSPGIEATLGFPPEDMIGRHWTLYAHPDDVPSQRTAWSRMIEQPTSIVTGEIRARHRDGSWRYLEIVGSNRLNEPDIGSLIFSFRDITDRKHIEDERQRIDAELQELVSRRTLELQKANQTMKAEIGERRKVEEALKKYSEEIADLYHNAPCGYHSLGPDGTFLRINDTELQWLGYSRDEIVGKKKLTDLLTPESLKVFHLTFPWLKKSGWTKDLELDLVRRDGTTLPVILNATAIRDSDRNFIMSRSSLFDITDRKRAEAERLLLVTAIEQAAEGIFLTDTKWIIQYTNPAFEKMLGYDKDEMIGWHAGLLKSGRHDRAFYRNIRETLISGRVWSGRGINKKKDGTFVDVDVTMSPVRDASGYITNYVCIHRDITREVALEAQLLQAKKMEAIGTLAGGIAHDFNNLLSAIVGHATLLNMETDLDGMGRERVKSIEELVESGAALTRQLLGFARKGRMDVKPVDMNRLLDRLIAMFGRTKREILIHKKFDGNLWATEADSSQMEQVFMNLFVNAWQAMPGGGNIYLETSNLTIHQREQDREYMRPGDYVKISVTDTGIGMDEDTKNRLFEPFFTTREIGRGTGLGLATVYGIIKGHDGYINVYSEKVHGTTFTIYLPSSKKTVSEEKEKPREEWVRGNENILVVDDEEEIVEVLEQMLKFLGYTVLVARSGQEGLKLYADCRDSVDLVILDMIMPGMGGGEAFSRLKEMNPDIKVLLSSGYSINGQAADILSRGCNGFIQKPVKLAELSQKVRAVLENKD